MSAVVRMDARPNTRDTTSKGTPWASMIVAAEWCRLCHGIEGNPGLALTLCQCLRMFES
jgi:hypothetical protein